MEKRSSIYGISKEEITKVEIPEAKATDKSTVSTSRKLRSMLPANLFIKGIFGKEYHFPMAGAEVNVDEEDFEFLLSKTIGNTSCCGGAGKTPLFEKV